MVNVTLSISLYSFYTFTVFDMMQSTKSPAQAKFSASRWRSVHRIDVCPAAKRDDVFAYSATIFERHRLSEPLRDVLFLKHMLVQLVGRYSVRDPEGKRSAPSGV